MAIPKSSIEKFFTPGLSVNMTAFLNWASEVELGAVLSDSSVDGVLSAPPGSPAPGSLYIVIAPATGLFAAQTNKLAWWAEGATGYAWKFIAPEQGWKLTSSAGLEYEYTGSAWQITPEVEEGYTASGTVTAGKLVKFSAVNSVNEFGILSSDDLGAYAGVAITGGVAGATIRVRNSGLVFESSWSFAGSIGSPLFCGVGGFIVSAPPAGYLKQIGSVVSAQSLSLSASPLIVTL